MAVKLARRGTVPSFIVMDVLREANRLQAAGRSILHLEVGQPGTAAPTAVRAAAARLAGEARLGYTDALGIPALRARIADHYRQTYGAAIDPARVVITNGASGAFSLAFLACFDAGDRVALAAPGYPAYRHILAALDLEPVLLPAEAEDGFQPTPALLDRLAGRIDGLIVANPANPTGTMLTPNALKAVADWCDGAGVRLISDEIYHGITYGPPAATALSVSADGLVINSFSKYFSMTGWRLGWMIVPEPLIRPIECLAQNLVICPSSIAQEAAVFAFECHDELQANVRSYAQNRALLLEELPKAGFTRFSPADGAFYLYADVGDLTQDSLGFCRRILAETGVALTPGLDFDPDRGHRFIRISFAGPPEDIAAAAARLVAWAGR